MSTLDVILIIILIAWLGGWGFHVGGNLIHFLLVVLLIGVIYRFLTGRTL